LCAILAAMGIVSRCALSALLAASPLAAVPNPEEYVNTLGGTDSRYDLSHGNLLPLVSRPWSFNTWAPQTDNDPTYQSWWFHPTDRRFFGIRCTHQPSPWISDYGQFRIMASITDPAHSDPWQTSGYDPTASSFKPYLFNATLIAYGNGQAFTTVELTSTNHGAIIRVTFPPYVDTPTSTGFNQTRRILFALNTPGSDSITVDTTATPISVSGYTTANSGGVTGNFAHYLYATIQGGVNGDQPVQVLNAQTASNGNLYAYFDFDPTLASSEVLTVRVATSLISVAQAQENFAQEINGMTFDQVYNDSKYEWRTTLSRANITDVGQAYSAQQQADLLTTFYSSLYRSVQFPRMLHETSANGSLIHYSPYDALGRTFPGPLSSDQGFWDAYRTVYPQLSLLYEDVLGGIIQGWTNAYEEGGWLPKWASPGYRGSMVGTMGDVSLADAIVKNISGFDKQAAYAAIRQDAFVVPPGVNGVGRECLQSYLDYGYIPQGSPSSEGTCYEVVARTQNYWLSDYAISQAANLLGRSQDAAILGARSLNYSNLFEPTTGFFRSKTMDGAWTQPFDEFAWGGDYTEAGPWQYRAYIPHDPQGLNSLYAAAGLDLCDVLEEANNMPSTFHIGAYGSEIHEMTEMALLCWGQYEHDNQPVHYMLPLMVALSSNVTGTCAARGQFWIRQALSQLYKPTADMFCGDEDNGEVASWYILNSLGLYALAPGNNDMVLTSPLFANVQINFPTGNVLNIVSVNNSPANVYVASVAWNGVPITGVVVDYFQLLQGGTLTFTMMGTPPASAKHSGLRAAGHRHA
jgi:predicted alpha-1,2-mannosidase